MRVTLDLTMCSESSGVNRAAPDFKQIFGGIFDDLKLKRKLKAKEECSRKKFVALPNDKKLAEIEEVSRKVRESFLQNEVAERPNTAGIAADFNENGIADLGWAISLTDNSPKHFRFDALHCTGQRVRYYNPEEDDHGNSKVGVITEVIFTLNGQVRYSVKFDDGTYINNTWSGWINSYCVDARKEIESTLGRQIIDDAIIYAALQLDWSRGDALHITDFVITQMAEFCSQRNVHFAMCPLECYAVFLHLVDRQVRHQKSQLENDHNDVGCDNLVAHRL